MACWHRRHDRWPRGRRASPRVAKLLARRLGYRLLDTGAIYRAVALTAQRRGIAWTDADGVRRARARARHPLRLRRRQEPRVPRRRGRHGGDPHARDLPGRLAGVGASRRCARRCSICSAGSARAAAWSSRAAIPAPSCSPHAQAKFFLTATEEERARRRVAELGAGGATTRKPSPRSGSATCATPAATWRPMKPADDAVLVDSSTQTIEQVVESLAEPVEARADASIGLMPARTDPWGADLIVAVDNSGAGRYQLAPVEEPPRRSNPSLGICRRSA